MKSLKQIFAEHDYGNTEWKESFVPMLTEWLTQKREFIAKADDPRNEDYIEMLDELLEELKKCSC